MTVRVILSAQACDICRVLAHHHNAWPSPMELPPHPFVATRVRLVQLIAGCASVGAGRKKALLLFPHHTVETVQEAA